MPTFIHLAELSARAGQGQEQGPGQGQGADACDYVTGRCAGSAAYADPNAMAPLDGRSLVPLLLGGETRAAAAAGWRREVTLAPTLTLALAQTLTLTLALALALALALGAGTDPNPDPTLGLRRVLLQRRQHKVRGQLQRRATPLPSERRELRIARGRAQWRVLGRGQHVH